MKDNDYRNIVKFGFGAVLAIVALLSLSIIGSPQVNRELRIDKTKITNVYNTQRAINEYYQHHNTLAPTIEHIIDRGIIRLEPQRFYTAHNNAVRRLNHAYKAPFYDIRYEITGEKSYRLCTSFHYSFDKRDDYRHYWEKDNSLWQHPAGNYCFEMDVPVEITEDGKESN